MFGAFAMNRREFLRILAVAGGATLGSSLIGRAAANAPRIAIDAVGVAILRLYGTTQAVSKGAIFEQEQIARAIELGLGVDGPNKIEFVTRESAGAEFANPIRSMLAAA